MRETGDGRRETGDGRREEACHPERSEIATIPKERPGSRFPVPGSRFPVPGIKGSEPLKQGFQGL